ncbi:MAG: acyl-CoA thioesterase [Polyangiales bacterium]
MRPRRSVFRHFDVVATRWMDNDVYGHVNNVVYYSYFDTVINRLLIAKGGLDIAHGPVIGLCVESFCQFKKPLAFPGDVDAGLNVSKLGTSSVRYELGLFARGDDEPAALGHFVHVFVARDTRRPHALPETIRAALAPLIVTP